MKRVQELVGAGLIALSVGWANNAGAQEITEAHIDAAWSAILAIGADSDFDAALPAISEQVQTLLLEQRPDLYREVPVVVFDVASELVPRRLDLNNEVALLWAAAFTEAELNEISAFFNGAAGEKLNAISPSLRTEGLVTLEIWSRQLATELVERSLLRFEQQGIDF